MVSYIARWWVGPDQRWILLPYSMLMAPVLLLCANIIGRLLVPGELRVLIVTAFISAPVLIWLVRRKKMLGGCDVTTMHLLIGHPDGLLNWRLPLRVLVINVSLLVLCLLLAMAALFYGALHLSF